MVVTAAIIDCFFVMGEGGRGGGRSRRSIKSVFDNEVFNQRKLVEMICTQPLLDVHETMKNCRCCCLRCRLSGVGGRGQATCVTGDCRVGWQLQL